MYLNNAIKRSKELSSPIMRHGKVRLAVVPQLQANYNVSLAYYLHGPDNL
ncbi:hypothetical protein ACU8KH_06644 [Lachancea thermotolerans]